MKHDENINSRNMHRGRKRFGNSFQIFFPLLAAALLQMTHPAPSHARENGAMSVEFLYSVEYTSGRSEKLRVPSDIFFDRVKSELYIAEGDGRKIYIYDNNGMFVQELRLNTSPGMIAVDGAGDIYAGHSSRAKISRFDFKGEHIAEIDIPGIVDVPGNELRPMRLERGPDGRIYVLKSRGGVVKLDPDNEAHEEISILGEGQPNVISGMGIDHRGRLLFTDVRPYSVVIFDPQNKTFQRFGSSGVLYGQIVRPSAVAADDAGHMFVLSLTVSKVSCYDKDGNFIDEFGGLGNRYGQFYMPTRIVSDGKNRLFVLEETLKRVQVFEVRFLREEKETPANSSASGRSGTEIP